jgi:ferric-dicitrate binding protein FerR (iron transport regulator)
MSEDLEREALRCLETEPVPAPTVDARERARAAFLDGRAQPRGTRRLRTFVPLAAAAAAVALYWLGSWPTAHWSVATAERAELGDGTPLIEATTFRHAAVRTLIDGELDARLGDFIRVLVGPDAEVELPPAAGRWIGRRRLLRVEAGDIFATTGGRKLPFELVIETAETRTRILGTTFAVRCNELGTCVCLLEGRIEVAAPDGGSRTELLPDGRVQFFEDGRPPMLQPLSPAERRMLEELRSAGL